MAENSNSFTGHDGQTYNYRKESSDPEAGGGAYGGSTVSSDGKVHSYQYVCPKTLGNWDGRVGDKKTGGYMLHEVAEGYASGKMAFQTGLGDAVGGNRYNTVHQAANEISGGGWTKYTYEDTIEQKTSTWYRRSGY